MLHTTCFVLLLLPLAAHAHMNLMVPESRVTLAWGSRSPRLCNGDNCNWEPQSVSSAIGQAPNGLCGDPKQEVGGLWWTAGRGRPGGTYTQGGTMTVTGRFTAFHMGRSIVRICRFSGDERTGFTQDCLEQNVLAQASNVGEQAGSTAWYHGAGTAPISSTTTFQLPPDLWCDGVTWKCVLQYRYQTGNTCTPNGTPDKFANRALPACSSGISMEQFWQCADIIILPANGTTPSSPSVTPPPPPPPPPPSPRVPSPAQPSPQPPRASPAPPAPKTSPRPSSPAPCGQDPVCFCAGRPAGMYADPASGCASYFWCAPTGAWYKTCIRSTTGVQLLFRNDRQQCDWPQNVQCPALAG